MPDAVLTETLPLPPDPTTAVMLLEDTTVKETAAIPPKLTELAPLKFVPVIVMVEPGTAVLGLTEVIAGAGISLMITGISAEVWLTDCFVILTE
jgi:hypothetical protein